MNVPENSVSSFTIQVISQKMVCRCMNVPENSVSSFAIQEISRKKVCRCSGWCVWEWFCLRQMWFSSAIQGIPLKKVCRCMNVPENGIFPFATQVISRKKVCCGGCEVRKGKERKGSG